MVLSIFRTLLQRQMQRSYSKQLLADKLSLVRVLLCGGGYADYRQLQQLYKLIGLGRAAIAYSNSCLGETQYDITFWDRYWALRPNYQPWIVAHFHRTLRLDEGDKFYTNTKTGRIWLYSDISDFGIPCGMIWDWLYAVAPKNLESTCLLASFSHKELFGELTRKIKDDPCADKGYLFASMVMAMLFRLGLSALSEEFEREAHEWKAMYASWDLESRLFLLNALACLDGEKSRNYVYAWGLDLFPEAHGMLEVAKATDVHPARLLRQWYDLRGEPMPESFDVTGLL